MHGSDEKFIKLNDASQIKQIFTVSSENFPINNAHRGKTEGLREISQEETLRSLRN